MKSVRVSLNKALNKVGLLNFDPNDRKTFFRICLFAPLFFGLLSWWWGADSNWDLLNYHFYNPYAFFHDRMQIDLAPAGMQSYFNPLIDIPYYGMVLYLPPRLVGFIMGAMHGINFILIAAIASKTLSALPAQERYRIPLVLAAAGCMTGSFLSTMGNTMGDCFTSLFILGTVLLILQCWDQLLLVSLRPMLMVVLAGFIAGLGAGLKLTNVVYALAICLSFLLINTGFVARIRLSFLFGIGVLAGMLVTSGYWFYLLWTRFGNPLFPQFGSYFPNSLARSSAVVDDHWRPTTWLETVLWPFVSSINPTRVGQLPMYQILWPLVYLLLVFWLIKKLLEKMGRSEKLKMNPEAQFVVAVLVIGYVIWMKMFSIQRYLVPLEICIPLVIFILMMQLVRFELAKKIALTMIVAATLVTLFGGLLILSHSPWTNTMVSVNIPTIVAPEKATAIIIGGDPPQGWIVPHFPAALAFAQVHGSFPETPSYVDAVHTMVSKRGGDVYGVIRAERQSGRFYAIARVRQVAADLGITDSDFGCLTVQRAQQKFGLHLIVTLATNPTSQARCSIDIIPSEMNDVTPQNRKFSDTADKIARQYGFALEPESCVAYSAYVGRTDLPYQWCRLVPVP